MHNSGRLSEVKLPWNKVFWIRLSVGSVRLKWAETKIYHDNKLGTIDDTTFITQKTRTIWFPQCYSNATYLSKCNTKDTLWKESDDTCVAVHETLGMSVKHFCITSRTHQHQIFPLKQAKTSLYMISDTSHAKRWHFLYK